MRQITVAISTCGYQYIVVSAFGRIPVFVVFGGRWDLWAKNGD